ncbi:MAG: S8 family peptidase [Ignavibacteria bacterium]|nr:S8 family peptidase [Ignavibacteria bacterium]
MKAAFLIVIALLITGNSFSKSPKIHEELQTRMDQASENTKLNIYVLFNEHLTLNDFSFISYDTPKDERRRIVIERLQGYADNYQRNVREFLNARTSEGTINGYEVLWLTNSIVTSAASQVINDLAAFDNVKLICFDPEFPSEMLHDSKQASPPFIEALPNTMTVAPEPGVVLMKADQVWALGNRGSGVIVANADDGFYWKHPDLVRNMWQNLGEDANGNGKTLEIVSGTGSTFDAGDINGVDNDGNGKIDDLIGWDFTTNNYNVTAASHGSATMGHVVGDGTGGTQTGVAPGAKGIPMRNGSGEAAQYLAFQYALQMGADVATSSLSWKWYFNPKPNYSQMRLVTDMTLAGGMIITNSTSNDGGSSSAPVPLNISTAGNIPPPWLHPEQLKRGNVSGVIGVGNVVCQTDVISSSSPSGPATWGNWELWGAYTYPTDSSHKDYPYSRVAPVELPDSMGLLKPDVSAPGNGSTSTAGSGTGYQSFSGTSSATPHTAGCVALMLSVNPEMLPQDVSKVIELTSVEKGAAGKDPRYGTGRIDALAATTSPKFTLVGINGGSNMVINNTVTASDTARELAGIRISTDVNPKVGSLRTLKFGMTTNATSTHILSFDLYWDKDRNNVVSSGDIKLRSHPFVNGPLSFDSLKFKFLDTARTLILAAKTSASASGQNISLGITDTNQVQAYYTTFPFSTNFPFGTTTGISGNNGNELSYSLEQNYPNPFNPVTVIRYTVPKDGLVKVRVYDALGKEVALLVNGTKQRGSYSIEFDGNDFKGISSGIYYYKMEAGDFTDIRKMVPLSLKSLVKQ